MSKLKPLVSVLTCTWALSLGFSLPQPGWAQKKKNDRTRPDAAEVYADAPVHSQAEAEYAFIEGMKFFALEKYDDALKNFVKALPLAEFPATILFKISETYARLGNLSQAEYYANEAIEEDAQNTHFYVLLATIYRQQARLEAAADTYRKLLDLADADPYYHYDLAQLYEEQGRYEQALLVYQQLEAKIGIHETLTQQKQRIYLNLNQTREAIAEGEKLRAAFPFETRFLVSLSELLIANQEIERALSLLEEALLQKNPEPRLFLVLAKIYQIKREPEKALPYMKLAFAHPELEAEEKVKIILQLFKESENGGGMPGFAEAARLIVEAHPSYAPAHTLYADILLQQNNKKQAKYHYLEATRYDTNLHPKVWHQILALDAEENQMDTLLRHAEAALELYPNQPLFWLYSGLAHLGKKNYAQAVEAFEEGRRMAIDQLEMQTDFTVYLADAYHGLGQYAESDAAYEKALRQSPDHPRALNNYSYFLALRRQKLEQAQAMAEKLVGLHPQNPSYLDTFAWVLYQSKDYKKARKYLEMALDIRRDGIILEHYGDVLYQLGEKEEALRQWQKAKAEGGTSDKIDRKINEKKLFE
ncbi:MAG: tetratricopeptide repeat protein [Microscillaceae bacterium]|nr:tetratricopeptide repeat protein [Microscillaceae bacterium]